MFRKFSPLSMALAGLLACSPALAADYEQAADGKSVLVFANKYDGVLFTGTFSDFQTHLSFDPQNPSAGHLEVTISLASANSGNNDRDSTLQGSAFFNTNEFPQARYSAAGFRALGDNQYAADGTLELRGVSKPVTLTFTWTDGAQPLLEGRALVNRLEFDVGGGDWADTKLIPDATAISTKVYFRPR